MNNHSTVYLSLGSNKGDRRATLDAAVALLRARVGEVEAVSSYHETEPWGFASPHRFLNAALRMRTTLQPFEVLEATQQIERALGRTSKSVDGQYADRPIDIDLLMWVDHAGDALQMDDWAVVDGRRQRLTLPHPLMQLRDFVLIPLNEVTETAS